MDAAKCPGHFAPREIRSQLQRAALGRRRPSASALSIGADFMLRRSPGKRGGMASPRRTSSGQGRLEGAEKGSAQQVGGGGAPHAARGRCQGARRSGNSPQRRGLPPATRRLPFFGALFALLPSTALQGTSFEPTPRSSACFGTVGGYFSVCLRLLVIYLYIPIARVPLCSSFRSCFFSVLRPCRNLHRLGRWGWERESNYGAAHSSALTADLSTATAGARCRR